MPMYNVSAIIIKKHKYHEADRLLTVFGRGSGKMTVRAKGVRRAQSKLAGHLETFSFTELHLAEGKTFDTVTGAVVKEMFSNLRADLDRVQAAFYAIELLDKVTPDGYKDSALFDLTLAYLREVDTIQQEKLHVLEHGFAVKLLYHLGFGPAIAECAECGEKITQHIFFAPTSFEFYCSAHAPHDTKGLFVSVDACKVLRFCKESDFSVLTKLAIPEDADQELERLIDTMYQHVAEKKMHAKKMFTA